MRVTTSQENRAIPCRKAGHPRLLALAVLISAASTLLAVPTASASRSETTLFDLGGAGLDLPPVQRDGELDQLKAFGVDTVRVIVAWRDIAPEANASTKPAFDATDPNAYPAQNWEKLDGLVTGARSRGMNVLLTPSTPAPHWATSAHDDFTDPNPTLFGQFVQALGTRYSGNFTPAPTPANPAPLTLPRVDRWSVGNEFNLTLFLKPQYRHGVSVAGRIYRNLFLAAQNGLRSTGHGSDPILIGETSPSAGRKGTDPITFLRGVFCLNSKFKRQGGCAPIDADGWAQHPYDPFDAPFEKGTHKLINLATISTLSKALNKARAARATTTRLPIYVTEYGVESVPDRRYGVSQLQQAEYIGISEYLMWRNPRIRSFGQYLMQDDSGRAQTNFQTGLRFSDGRKKLSYAAFPIALVAQRVNEKRHRVRIWGHVRPKGAPFNVTVKASGSGGAHTIKNIHTTLGGYFQFSTPFRKGRRYSASTRLPDGTQLTGPFVRTYVFK
jgi:hypothetical protein